MGARPRWLYWIPLAVLALVIAAEIYAILSLNSGKLVYTLDDPYIHLALAEEIAHGNYGVNPGELAAPSSSIAWPFLLAPFAWIRFLEFAPLAINIATAFATLFIFIRFEADALDAWQSRRRAIFAAVVAVLFIFSLNLVGLIFTGMEHSLQVLFAVMLVAGLARESQTGRVPPILIAAIILGPLFRYENLALSLPAIGYLFVRRHSAAALFCSAVLVCAAGGFSLWLHDEGLGWLPSSVLVKSAVVSATDPLTAIGQNVLGSLQSTHAGWILCLCGVAWLAVAFSAARPESEKALAGVLLVGTILHLCVGRYGWYARYEIYILAANFAGALFLFRSVLARYADTTPPVIVTLILCLGAYVLGYPYIEVAFTTPTASNDIYGQHYQMHRFATEFYNGPVAVNDLGWVAFQNDDYVLDLAGLGSKEARELHQVLATPRWMEEAVSRHGVEFAMIYDSWFHTRPKNWKLVGVLYFNRPVVSAGGDMVSFYALTPQAYARAAAHLDEFARSLPDGVGFFKARPPNFSQP